MSSLEKCFAMAKDNESARKGGVTDGRVGKEREREREQFWRLGRHHSKIEWQDITDTTGLWHLS